jgi:glycerophosphoryl diester phosphodiesterase
VIVFAHRGASAERPENTIEAFDRAVELGVDRLEADVHATRDGKIVVAHDADGLRMAGEPGRILTSSFVEVRSWDVGARFVARRGDYRGHGPHRVPSLEEVLEATRGTPLNLDVKHPSAVEGTVRAIRRANSTARVLLTSFSDATTQAVRALGYEGPTGLARNELLVALGLGRHARGPLRPLGVRAQLPLSVGGAALDTPAALERLHALDLAVDFWVVDDPERAARLVGLGADGVMTDDPAAIVPAVRRARGLDRGA